ncbi:MAG: hypothetical protein DME80_14435 [Verrucomicrobia bacterium]|nr:MAG: hypothetical protein DME80_14435 [Verrucomicrobiota bacterium]
MKTNPTAQESGWRVSFWFALSSPLIGVLLAFLAVAATDSETGANNSEPVPAESLNQPMIMPKRTGAEKSKFLKCRSSEA